jgi:hypothetical protein
MIYVDADVTLRSRHHSSLAHEAIIMSSAAGASAAPRLVTAMILMTTLALLFLALRLFCKLRYGKPVGWDDWILAGSWVSYGAPPCLVSHLHTRPVIAHRPNQCLLCAYAALSIASTHFGIGQHISTLSADQIVEALKIWIIASALGPVSIATSKSSFALTLLRLATARWHVVLLWFVLVTTNLSLCICGILVLARCTPIERIWDFSVPGTCVDAAQLLRFAVFSGGPSKPASQHPAATLLP